MGYDYYSVPLELDKTTDLYVFAQVACESSQDFFSSKQNWALLCCCLGVFICWGFSTTVSHLYGQTFIDEKLINLEFTTLKDFCVQGSISKKLFEAFAESVGTREIKTFKASLIERLRDQLHT